MKDLKQCRIEIDAIDQQLMELFEKRMALSKSVVEYKIEKIKILKQTLKKILL